MNVKMFDSVSFCGYEQKTTFFTDFSIADMFGVNAIKDTYNRAFKHWKHNTEYLTELVMVLNWKSWEHEKNDTYCSLYTRLYYQTYGWACDNLKGDDLEYFFRTTD